MIYRTSEVRWFYQSTAPPEVVNWFNEGQIEPEEQSMRVDYYLRLPESDRVGIKLREGRIEVKRRVNDHREVSFHERVAGNVESWVKWSFTLADELSDHTVPMSKSWLPVRKMRWLRKFEVVTRDNVLEIPVDSSVVQGCYLELSNVKVNKTSWWSVCFEAFGEGAEIQNNLVTVADHIFSSHNPPQLEIGQSFAYPQFLIKAGAGLEV